MFNFETLRYFMISTAFGTFMFGLIFLLLFKQGKQKYMLFWGLAFIMYFVMFMIDFYNIGVSPDNSLYVLARQPFSFFSALFMLIGVCNFFEYPLPKIFFIGIPSFIVLLCVCLIFETIYAIFIIPIIVSCSFTIICAGILFNLNSRTSEDIEQYLLSFAIILWGVYSNNFPFTRDYLGIALSNYFISLILLNSMVILFLVVHFKRSHRALALQEAHYRMLVENASGLIFHFSHKKMKFEYISPSCSVFFGHSVEDLYKDPSLMLENLDEGDAKKIERLFYTPSDSPQNFIFQVYRRGRPYKWYELHSTPIYNGNIISSGVEFTIRDVSARVEAENRLRRSEKARKELIEDISHELRTPVTLIQGYSESILNDMVRIEDYKPYIEVIHSKIITLNTLLEDLIQVSKFTSQSMEYSFYEHSASTFLNKMLIEYKIFVENNRRSCLCLNYIEEDCIIIADEFRIGQVFSNLVGNALKYTDTGEHIEIICRLLSNRPDSPSTKILIQIKDSGKGIDPEDLPNLFKRKYRGKSKAQSDTGFGLGLYLCKEIIKQHSGNIWAENNEDKGASFFFTLPCSLIESAPRVGSD